MIRLTEADRTIDRVRPKNSLGICQGMYAMASIDRELFSLGTMTQVWFTKAGSKRMKDGLEGCGCI